MTPRLLLRQTSLAVLAGATALLLSSCAMTPAPYGYDEGADIGVDYYEPYGVAYRGWGPGYGVGPYREGGHRPVERSGGGRAHAYRSPAPGRATPSLPSHSRAAARPR